MYGSVVATTGNNSSLKMPSLKDPVEESPNGVQFKRIKDRSPYIKAAGKRYSKSSESAKDCMVCPDKEISPEIVKKFHAFTEPDPGVQKVFYGRASDPDRELAAKIYHGVGNKAGVTCKELISPPPNTHYHDKVVELKEKIYASKKKAPLGKGCQQSLFAPEDVKSIVGTFGKSSDNTYHLYDIVTPPVKYSEVLEAAEKDHEWYARTHGHFFPGEQVKRNYTFPSFDPRQRFGESVSHWNDGHYMRTALNWATLTADKNAARIVPKLQEDFRERTQSLIGEPLDPIKDTLFVPDDHCFGLPLPCKGYSVKDLMHNGCPLKDIKDPVKLRGLLISTRRALRCYQYQQFDALLSHLTQCDRKSSGCLPVSIVMEFCLEYRLPVDFCVASAIVQNCNPGDGLVFYERFLDFINWTKPLPDMDEFPVKDATLMNKVDGQNIKIESKSEPCSHSENPTAITPGTFKTSSSDINSFVGKVSTKDWKKSGVPTARIDLEPPVLKPVASNINYGNEGSSNDFVSPTIFECHGVSKKDLKSPRSFAELKEIFMNIGCRFDQESLERFYNHLSKKDQKGEVNIESFWNLLNNLPASLED